MYAVKPDTRLLLASKCCGNALERPLATLETNDEQDDKYHF